MKKLCHFVDEGKGAPLFLVHGIGASHRAWDGVVADMKKSFRCIRYDLRGHGESSVPAYPWRLEDLAADLENLRKKIGEKKNTHRRSFFGRDDWRGLCARLSATGLFAFFN